MTPTSSSSTKVIEGIDIAYEGIEEPFKEMLFMTEDKLLIHNYGYQCLVIDLRSNNVEQLTLDDASHGVLHTMSQNKQGIVYLQHTDWDKLGIHYRLMEYNFKEKTSKVLVPNIVENSWRDSYVYLRTDPASAAIFLQVDNKVYLYDYHQLRVLDLEAVEILAYRAGILLYRDKSWAVQSYLLK